MSERLEHLADQSSDVSMRELLTRISIRHKIFWSSLIIPVVLALLFTALIPTTWSASVQILLRYSSTESPFLQGLIPESRKVLSGGSSAEILRGIPTLVKTIREQQIEDEDIYKESTKVLGGYISGFVERFFPSSLPPGLPGIDPKTLLLAKSFQDSLSNKTSFGNSKKQSVEILKKTSQLSVSEQGDELISVKVRSFNRQKVAAMANGLASAFIEEYYKHSAEESHRAYEFLNTMVKKAERDVAALQNGSDSSGEVPLLEAGNGDAGRSSPLLDNMSRELAKLQNELIRAEGVYVPGSDAVRLLRYQVQRARTEITHRERIENAKEVLEQLKLRRYQALNTAEMYKNHLIPISVAEPAFTPKKSLSKVLVRYLIAGGVGLVLGFMLALGLVIVLDVIDPYLRTSWQTKRLGVPVITSLPELGEDSLNPVEVVNRSELSVVNGLLQLLGKMVHAKKVASGGRVVVLSSAQQGEGKTLFSLALANALIQSKHHKVLLIDAELHNAGLTNMLELSGTPGFIDSMIDLEGVENRIVKGAYLDCDVLAAGNLELRNRMGFYSEELAGNISRLRELYDFIIIDTASILSSNEALICGQLADSVLLVTSMGQSRKRMVQIALQRMMDVGAEPEGAIINRQLELLPGFIYRNV